nr:aminotransferase class I/II-fold pyridoxal phosphate-dependent enzyme [Anaerolineae bacterium]
MRIANRVANLPAYVFAEAGKTIAAMKTRGVDVIDLGIGSPDLAPPDWIVERLYAAAQDPHKHGYAGYYGLPALRRAMAGYYQSRFGVALDADRQVVALIGSKEGIYNVAQAFVDAGDVALIPDPGYPTYQLSIIMAGGSPVPMPLQPELGFMPDLRAIPHDALRRAKLM